MTQLQAIALGVAVIVALVALIVFLWRDRARIETDARQSTQDRASEIVPVVPWADLVQPADGPTVDLSEDAFWAIAHSMPDVQDALAAAWADAETTEETP